MDSRSLEEEEEVEVEEDDEDEEEGEQGDEEAVEEDESPQLPTHNKIQVSFLHLLVAQVDFCCIYVILTDLKSSCQGFQISISTGFSLGPSYEWVESIS